MIDLKMVLQMLRTVNASNASCYLHPETGGFIVTWRFYVSNEEMEYSELFDYESLENACNPQRYLSHVIEVVQKRIDEQIKTARDRQKEESRNSLTRA